MPECRFNKSTAIVINLSFSLASGQALLEDPPRAVSCPGPRNSGPSAGAGCTRLAGESSFIGGTEGQIEEADRSLIPVLCQLYRVFTTTTVPGSMEPPGVCPWVEGAC